MPLTIVLPYLLNGLGRLIQCRTQWTLSQTGYRAQWLSFLIPHAHSRDKILYLRPRILEVLMTWVSVASFKGLEVTAETCLVM